MYKFGLIGGGMAGPLHANAIQKITGAELTAFCDIDPAVCRKYQEQYGFRATYQDYREMLQKTDVDIVCIITPPFLHEEMVLHLAQARKHIICEKPLAINLMQADRMIEACEQAGVKLGVISMYRFMEQIETIRQAVNAGKLGRILAVDCIGKSYRDDAYYASAGWRGTWAGEGGGSLMSQTIHFIDLMLYVMGDVEYLHGDYLTTAHNAIEVDDLAHAVFRFKNGALGSVVSATAIRPGFQRRLEIHGEKGTVILEEEKIVAWQVEGMNELDYLTKEQVDSGDTATKAGYTSHELHKRQIMDFIAAVKQGGQPAVGGMEGRRTLEFIRAIYLSAIRGQKIRSLKPSSTATLI